MADLRTLKDRAAEHARKGRFDKAVELLSVVVTADPKDLGAKQKLGDALRRAGDVRDAVNTYREVVEAYAAQGEVIKAIAVCKVILDVDPRHADAQAMLADLHARRRQEPSRPVGVTPGRGLATGVSAREELPEPAVREPTIQIELLAGPADAPQAENAAPEWLERGSSVLVPPPPPEVAAARAEALGGPLDLGPEDELPYDDPSAYGVAAPYAPGPADERAAAYAGAADFAAAVRGGGPADFAAAYAGPAAPPEPAPQRAAPAPPDRHLPEVPLFSDLSRDAFVALAGRLELVRVAAGAAVVREGDGGRSLFVVVSGRLRVERATPAGPVVLARVGEGDFFGEMSLLASEPRMASVVAEQDCELLEIGAEALAELCRAHHDVAVSLTRFYRQRLLANAVATSPVFAPFSGEDRDALARRFATREVKPGDVLVREGARSDGLYVVLSGRYDVVRGEGAAAKRVAGLREGDLFGEMSCLSKRPAAATVVARRRGLVLRLPREDFDEIAMSHPQILELVAGLADQRKQSLEAVARAARPGAPGPYLV